MTNFVSVQLSAPWPTAKGLRKPQEGPITVSLEEAKKIEEEGHGKILDKPKSGKKAQDSKPAEKALASMTKDELVAVGEAEKVETAKDDDGKEIAFADATNPQMVTAIEAARTAKG